MPQDEQGRATRVTLALDAGGNGASQPDMRELQFPFDLPPPVGRAMAVAPGLLWLRLALPFRLNHVNVYLLEDDDGWTVVDTGVDDTRTREIWIDVIETIFGSKPLRRVIVTHFHPDHVGAAAFLCAHTGAVLMMGETEYLTAKIHVRPADDDGKSDQTFYRRHGLGRDACAAMAQRLDRYRLSVPDLPRTFEPLREGDHLRIGGRRFTSRCFAGHSPAQMLLHAPDDDLLLAADHILPQISPNISVGEEKPADDPLGLYLASFDVIRATIPNSVLVLPGHRLPFYGLHRRTHDLAAHHAERCAVLLDACAQGPMSVAAIMLVLFPMDLDAHQLWFAFSEALAHVNHLARRGALRAVEQGGVLLWSRRDEPVSAPIEGDTP